MIWLLVSFCLLQAPSVQASPQIPARDAPPAPPVRTATIRGRVTDRETGVAVPRVVVSLVGQEFIENPVSATTGDDGRYVLTGVPAGSHTLMVTMPPHRTMYLAQVHGDPEPLDPMRMSRPRAGRITIGDGETREGVDVQLSRALGISGRVVNDLGEPMSDVRVRLEQVGGTEFAAAPRQTDDRGTFRLFGLRPGSYRVCADPEHASLAAGKTHDAPQTTCYPADDEPGGLTLSTSDPPDIEIRVRRGRTFTISGTVVDASGAPVNDVNVSVLKLGSFAGGFGHSTVARSGGRFSADGLVPGEYMVRGSVGQEHDPLETRERQVGVLTVRVDSSDVEGLALPLARGGRVTGKVLVDDGSLPERTRLAITAVYDDVFSQGFTGPEPAVAVSDGATFELRGLFGPVRFACSGLPSGWVVKAVRYQDRDITYRPTEFPADATHAVDVVISSRGARVSGAVLDESGNPAPEGSAVVLIPTEFTGDWSPAIPMAQVTGEGTFETPGLRAGDYIVVAVEPAQLVSMFLARSANLKARLSKVAQRIELSEGERRTIDLRVVKIPEDR